MSIYDKASLVHIPSGVKSGTLYNVLPNNADGDFDFTRSSTATRVNKDGLIEDVAIGVPRLNYPLLDGVVQDCPALLLEPSRTNNLQRSEEFDNGYWNKSLISVTANDSVSPDGSVTADKIVSGNSTGNHFFRRTNLTYAATNNTFSVFAKFTDDLFEQFHFIIYDGSNHSAYFDVKNGSVISADNGITASMINYGSGWYRCIATYQTASTSVGQIKVELGSTSTTTGDDTSGMLFWGMQWETGSYPTSYLKTEGSAVTRSADAANGAEATFNDSEGVLFLETSMLSSNPDDSTFQIDDGTSTNRVRIRFTTTTNQINGLLYSGVAGQPNINYTANDVTNPNKVAIRYQVGQIDLFFNGFEVATITGNATPTGFDNLSLGTEGVLKQAMTFNEALSDTELEDLTSWDSFNEMATEQLYTIE